ncbi:MAG: magnesium chelatase ATPase subunit D, partial [Acetobacteraceae bacterium]|nr:magnesium chelatase ATPase subunit D [Acetobacteraceae bacterium]
MSDAATAAALLAVDPAGLGGAVLRAPAGEERDRWLALFRALLPEGAPWRRMPPSIQDDALLGGLDLPATLAARRPVHRAGLLAEAAAGAIAVPMAERLTRALAARLLKGQEEHGFALLALDEGRDDEAVPPAIADRLAFLLELREVPGPGAGAAAVAGARARLPGTVVPDEVMEAVLATASACGIASLRAPWLTL